MAFRNSLGHLFLPLFLITFGLTGCTGFGTAGVNTAGSSAALTVALSSTTQVVNQSAGTISANVTLSKAAATAITVSYAFVDLSAASGVDYTATPGSVTFAVGETTKTITATLINQNLNTTSRSFRIDLVAVTGGTATLSPTQPSQTVTIIESTSTSTVGFTAAAQSVYESGTALTVTAQLSAATALPATVALTVTGTAPSGDYSLSQTSITIPAGSTSASITLTPVDNSTVDSDRTVILTMGTVTNATASGTTAQTVTIKNDDIGAFTIQGIQSNALDTTSDAYLNNEALPKIMIAAAGGATSYDVTVYESDGTTVKCATQNTTTIPYLFSSCTLTAGTSYKVAVAAKLATFTKTATNSPYTFTYNRAPVAVADSVTLAYDGAAVTFDPRTNDSDADGDTLSITAVTQPAFGAATYTSTSVTFTPDNSGHGMTSFTYTLSDGHGGTANGTVTVRAMTGYTWTGLSSTTPRVWNDAANWCGAVTSPGVSGVCAGSSTYPTDQTVASQRAVFNSACTNCNAQITSAVQAYAIDMQTGYTGTLTQATGMTNTISIGAGGWTMQAGTFTGGNANLTINAVTNTALDIQAGSFTDPVATVTLAQSGATGSKILNVADGISTGLQVGQTEIWQGAADGSPTYNITIGAGSSWASSSLKAQSTGGTSASDQATINYTAGTAATAYLYLPGDFEFGRASGSGTIVFNNTGAFGVNGNILATAGARGGSQLNLIGTTPTYGSTGDGLLPRLSIYSTANPSTTNVSMTALSCNAITLPSGTLTIYGDGMQFYDNAGVNANGGTIKFLPLSMAGDDYIQIQGAATGDLHLHNVEVDAGDGPAGSHVAFLPLGTNFYIDGSLTLRQDGTRIFVPAVNYTVAFYLGGDLTIDSATGLQSNIFTTMTMNGTGAQAINLLNGASFLFSSMIVTNAGGAINLNNDLVMTEANTNLFEVKNGAIFNANNHNITWGDGSSANGYSTVQVDAGGALNMGATGILTSEATTGTVNH